MRTTSTAAVAAAAIAALALAGCSGGSTPTASQADVPDGYVAFADDSIDSAGGSLQVQVDYDTAEAQGLDPAYAEVARSWSIMGLVYESLVTVGPGFEIQPELASEWEQPDATTYVFTIQPDATFSNGRAVTAADVVGSLQRLVDSGSVWSGQLGPVASIEDTSGDAQQVTVTLETPYTPFLAALANTPAAILPMEELTAGTFDPVTEMLGTGAFTVAEHRQDESWTFDANPGWWDADALGIDTLELVIAGDEQTRLAGLRDGSTQLANFSNPDALQLLQSASNVTAVSQTQSDFFYAMLNSVNPDSPFADPEVRQTVNALIDRQALVDVALAGAAEPTAVTPANLPDACTPDSVPSASAEVDADALAGVEASILIYNSDPALAAIAQLMQQQLEAAGAEIELESVDDGTFGERVYVSQPGDFDIALSWFAGYGDASIVTSWWNPETAFFNVGFTQSHDDLSEAIVAAQQLEPGAERAEALQTVCDLADEYAEMLPLATRPQVIGFASDQLSPSILADEGYGDFLRLIADFRTIGG
ncbi:ABC transporter substrate-binding protein [Agrococcus jejuensis]|uniref:ABC-type transport system, substrate-binding protein n=1 Tax=Agrococcus jejuensis TaxID=399736 RepID=A0A1G8DJV1_9MICO|nr:ABC transporter substrate-binding protein [Agrococcus jejuensis]SDH57924.1 ABC-type transport system, substrate-binding protein [Agrococcus jejuensis]